MSNGLVFPNVVCPKALSSGHQQLFSIDGLIGEIHTMVEIPHGICWCQGRTDVLVKGKDGVNSSFIYVMPTSGIWKLLKMEANDSYISHMNLIYSKKHVLVSLFTF